MNYWLGIELVHDNIVMIICLKVTEMCMNPFQVDDSEAPRVSPLPALPSICSFLSLLALADLPDGLPCSFDLAIDQSDEGRQRPGPAGVLLPPRRP